MGFIKREKGFFSTKCDVATARRCVDVMCRTNRRSQTRSAERKKSNRVERRRGYCEIGRKSSGLGAAQNFTQRPNSPIHRTRPNSIFGRCAESGRPVELECKNGNICCKC